MKLPESPKFLLTQGKHEETLDCLKFIYKWNNKTDAKFPVRLIDHIYSEENDNFCTIIRK